MESDSSSGNSSASSDSVSGVSSDSTAPKRQQGQKRLRRVEQWGRKKRKVMKDSGKAYKTYKGERRSSKTMKESLSCRCQNHCASRVTVAERKHIFDEFYKLADHDSQNKYLFGLIERSVPKQRRPRSAAKKARGNRLLLLLRLSEIWRPS